MRDVVSRATREDMSIEQPYPRQPHEGDPGPLASLPDPQDRTGSRGRAGRDGRGGGRRLRPPLSAVNPMGDEWHCSDGEAPAGKPPSYSGCYDTDKPLPRGLQWDPWGNRPMPYNCDKDGWMLIERIPRGGQPADVEEDCVREGTELPGRWHPVDELSPVSRRLRAGARQRASIALMVLTRGRGTRRVARRCTQASLAGLVLSGDLDRVVPARRAPLRCAGLS